jgi:hypothetical protein
VGAEITAEARAAAERLMQAAVGDVPERHALVKGFKTVAL